MMSFTPEDWGKLTEALKLTTPMPRDSDPISADAYMRRFAWFHLFPAMEMLSWEKHD